MDTKSLAKSKRAHSQHHSKKHHPKTLKGSSTTSIGAASSSKIPPGNEIKEKPPRQFQGSSALPSNWDRYEEEFDLAVEGSSSQDRTSNDVVLPKSKGADYGYLISEAKSQYQTRSSESEIFPSLHDVMNDVGQGMGTYLSVRGESILSWTEGDSFAVEDKETANNEASFFSLDLHALAEQLAKVDLSKRLFIEADLLPPELFTEDLQASHNCCQAQPARGAEMENEDTEEVPASIISSGSSETRTSNHIVKGFSYDQSKSTERVEDEPPQLGRSGRSTVPEFTSGLDASSDTDRKPPGFEAGAAEAELDMLLGSFNETSFLDLHGSEEKTSYISHMSLGRKTAGFVGGSSAESLSPRPPKRAPDVPRPALSIDLDDTLDDLLKETSSLISQNVASQSREVKATPSDFHSSSSLPNSKARVLDDFDSWLDTI